MNRNRINHRREMQARQIRQWARIVVELEDDMLRKPVNPIWRYL